MNPALESTLLEKVFGKPQHVDEMPAGEVKKTGEEIAKVFTTAVEGLMNFDIMPNVQINKLMEMLFHLCRTRTVLTAMAPVPTIHFWAEQKHGEKAKAVILVPPDFVEQIQRNCYFVCGGLVFIASQAQDFWNGKLEEGQDRIMDRSWVYEAEYLLTLRYNYNERELDDYQKHVLNKFPDGLQSMPKELRYESKDPPI